MPGPTHLFFTTGIYYTYLLQKEFRVVLLLEKRFNPKPELILEKIEKFNNNVMVEYIKPHGGLISALELHKKSIQIFDKYQPKIIFMHSTVFPQNIYFFLEARQRKIPVCHYLNALMTEDDEMLWKLYVTTKRNYFSLLRIFISLNSNLFNYVMMFGIFF